MIIDFLSKNWIGTLIGIAGIVISIIVSYYFYKKSQVKCIPAYQTKKIRIIDIENRINIDNVDIKYNNRKVNRLSKVYLVFWNDGNKTIDGKDIVDKDKLRVTFNSEDGEILSTKVIKVTRNVNEFRVIPNKEKVNEALIEFNFLDPSDGAVVEILHSLKKSELDINGSIKGIPKGAVDYGQVFDLSDLNKKNNVGIFNILKLASSKIVLFIYVIIGLLFIYCGFNTKMLPRWIAEPTPTFNKWSSIFMGIMLILPITLAHYNYPKRKFPKKLTLTES